MKIGLVKSEGKRVPVIIMNGSVLRKADDETNESFFDGDWSAYTTELKGPFSWSVPVPYIPSLRDFYSFEGHVKNARMKRGLGMEEEWYRIPAYYYSGTSMLYGTGENVEYPSFSNELDYEVEFAIVIGKEGINIPKEKALSHVFGLMLANDWSARDLQRREMRIGLGPSKSKDFGTSLGPHVTTMDELRPCIDEHGKPFIEIRAYVNGREYFSGNTNDMYWGITDMIEWASTGTILRQGDVIMSGTLSNGSILEKENNGDLWLRRGDVVRIESPQLGTLENRVV